MIHENGKLPRFRFSLRTLFVLVFAAGILFSGISYLGIPTERNAELRRAKRWEQGIDVGARGQHFYSIVVRLEGETFGISTHIKSQSHGGWTYDDGRLADRFFAYPPGEEVSSIEEAFHLFDGELNRMSR